MWPIASVSITKHPKHYQGQKTEKTHKINLDEKLLALMIDETDEQHDLGTECFEQNQSGKERAGSHIDSHVKETQ